MPPGIRPLTEHLDARERMARVLRPVAVALLFLLVWAATLAPAAMAASPAATVLPQTLGLFEYGGEAPAAEATTQLAGQVRNGQPTRQSSGEQTALTAAPSGSHLRRTRRQIRPRPAGTSPRRGPPRGRRRGRAPPR